VGALSHARRTKLDAAEVYAIAIEATSSSGEETPPVHARAHEHLAAATVAVAHLAILLAVLLAAEHVDSRIRVNIAHLGMALVSVT